MHLFSFFLLSSIKLHNTIVIILNEYMTHKMIPPNNIESKDVESGKCC